MGDFTKYNPWRAPGTAIPADPCGLAGGAGVAGPGPDGGADPMPKGFKYGDKGTELPATVPAVWKAGTTTEVAFGLSINHGGGYQYRICPKTENITEACFQKMPLAFATNTHIIHYEDGK